jgi:hypothetical protein
MDIIYTAALAISHISSRAEIDRPEHAKEGHHVTTLLAGLVLDNLDGMEQEVVAKAAQGQQDRPPA